MCSARVTASAKNMQMAKTIFQSDRANTKATGLGLPPFRRETAVQTKSAAMRRDDPSQAVPALDTPLSWVPTKPPTHLDPHTPPPQSTHLAHTRVKANGNRPQHLEQMRLSGAVIVRQHKWHVLGCIFVQVYGDKRCHLPFAPRHSPFTIQHSAAS